MAEDRRRTPIDDKSSHGKVSSEMSITNVYPYPVSHKEEIDSKAYSVFSEKRSRYNAKHSR